MIRVRRVRRVRRVGRGGRVGRVRRVRYAIKSQVSVKHASAAVTRDARETKF